VPAFRAGDPAHGLEAGIDAMMAATRGEYKPAATLPTRHSSAFLPLFVFTLIVIILIYMAARGRRGLPSGYGRTYSRRRGSAWGAGPWIGGGFGGGGGGGYSGGGGGFSGGGGSFGGGGASGSW
jgi:uncharacterized protein